MPDQITDTIRKTAVPCDCGCEAVLIWEFDQWGDEPHHVVVDLIVGYYAASFRARAKAAWQVLRGKDPWLHSMCFQDEAIGQIRRAFGGGLRPLKRETNPLPPVDELLED